MTAQGFGSPHVPQLLFLSIVREKKIKWETWHRILISSHVSHFMPDAASSCSNNSSCLRYVMLTTPGQTQVRPWDALQVPMIIPAHHRGKATVITPELPPNLLQWGTFSRTSMPHLGGRAVFPSPRGSHPVPGIRQKWAGAGRGRTPQFRPPKP